MELTIEHMLPYAAHNLKMRFMHPKEEFQKDGILSSIHLGSGSYEDIKLYIDFSEGEHIWMYKPHLHPLSDLTKEIEHNGERFVPIEEWTEKYYTLDFDKQMKNIISDSRWINHVDYLLIQILHEHHFDTFDLIEHGLALDKNKLK